MSAARIYVNISINGSISTYLVTAKSRIDPFETVSLPRLELCGSVLAAEMSEGIISKLAISTLEVFFWTDSTIVLSWLKKPPCSSSTFVANRVSAILGLVWVRNWFHVYTHHNPADLATRGLLSSELISSALQWSGSDCLRQSQSQWTTRLSNVSPLKHMVHIFTSLKTFWIPFLTSQGLFE